MLKTFFQQKKFWIFTTFLFVSLFLISIFWFSSKDIFSSKSPKNLEKPTLKSELTTNSKGLKEDEFVDCIFNSKYFGFSFVYQEKKGFCFENDEEDITSYSWPTSIDNLMIYPKNNLSGKVWWKKHIFDEVGYLAESKYSFEFSKTVNGVEKMSVYINDEKLIEGKDLVIPSILRGSDYYFGKNWVIRRKVLSSGGPAENIEKFENTLRLIFIDPFRENSEEPKNIVNLPKELLAAIERKIVEKKLIAPEGYLPYRPDITNNTRLSNDENWVLGIVIAPQGEEIIEANPHGSAPVTEFFVGKKENPVWKIVIDNTGENKEFLSIINQLPEELLNQKSKDFFNNSYREK